jgi:hypothetical protein
MDRMSEIPFDITMRIQVIRLWKASMSRASSSSVPRLESRHDIRFAP